VTGALAGVYTREPLRAYVNATNIEARIELLTLLRRGGIVPTAELDGSADTVVVAAGSTVDEAMDACPEACLSSRHPLLLVADSFPPTGVMRAVKAGVRAMFWFSRATPEQLAAAVQAAHLGECRIPQEAMVRLLGGVVVPGKPAPRPASAAVTMPLTPRQTAVLELMAEGHGNAAIAHTLLCSEHTVKNVIYDMAARLQVRNRAQAVAYAVTEGLI
jgi:DNA-binding NarL/FixJ family response regulator